MRPLVLASRTALVFALAACSSSSSSSTSDSAGAGAGASDTGDPDASASCRGPCCAFPAPGTPCDADASQSCAWARTCPTGLVASREVACTAGAWQSTSDCPEDGELDARGCPARQPEDGAACTLSPGVTCGYVVPCAGYRKSATAICISGAWQTTPLGTCDD